MKNDTCKKLCEKSYTGGKGLDEILLSIIRKGISLNYQHHWIVDNMPVTHCPEFTDGQLCTTGFPMGCYSGNTRGGCYHGPHTKEAYFLYNHVDLIITYHSGAHEEWGSNFGDKGGRIISVKVIPKTINHRRYVYSTLIRAIFEFLLYS